MLNPFPLQFLTLLAFFVLRIFIGLILLYLGWKHVRHFDELRHCLKLRFWPFGSLSVFLLVIAELTLAGFIMAGAHTQYAVLILALFCIEMLIIRNWIAHHTIPPKIFWFLLLGCSLMLFITGAGAPAFDLPL